MLSALFSLLYDILTTYFAYTIIGSEYVINILRTEIYVSYASIAIGIIIAVHVFKIQQEQQKVTSKNLTEASDMIKYQNKLNKIVVDNYNQNTLSFLNGIKSPLRQIDNYTRYIIDEILKYLDDRQSYDDYKEQSSNWKMEITFHFNLLNSQYDFYRNYFDFPKYHLIRSRLFVYCDGLHHLSLMETLDGDKLSRYMTRLDEIIDTLSEFETMVIKDCQQIIDLREQEFSLPIAK
jgi:hypothetical protein